MSKPRTTPDARIQWQPVHRHPSSHEPDISRFALPGAELPLEVQRQGEEELLRLNKYLYPRQ